MTVKGKVIQVGDRYKSHIFSLFTISYNAFISFILDTSVFFYKFRIPHRRLICQLDKAPAHVESNDVGLYEQFNFCWPI